MKIRASSKKSANVALISQLESKKVNEALDDEIWVTIIKEELKQFNKKICGS